MCSLVGARAHGVHCRHFRDVRVRRERTRSGAPQPRSRRYATEHLARAVPPVPRGFGPTRPVATNGTVEGRAANRRVAFTVVKTRARVIEAEMHPSHEVPHTLKRKCITSPSWTT